MDLLVKQPNRISANRLGPTLRLVVMPSDPDLALSKARLAYWLRMCRETDPRKPTLAAVAVAAGLSRGSGSVVSQWENNLTVNPPKLPQLQRLSAFYGVPLSLFTEPPETDEERLASTRRILMEAVEEEVADWAAQQASHRAAGGGRGEEPRRRTA